ncbi:MAG: DUF881 domain-containing protein [Armatimonadota bacterium]|nr:DUF881 domain-containing protein [Armatimonadota bacterium]MDR7401870.1 DUF881 domain-containing protein [Armatimonadota bacterium]MDR7403900.1 DUF881 domain-containing protein [Armatimonadota bacterium]MDR7437414.1 DUF881 domain-containing protein [Armatimonadota bacterium]MDR7473165.1 DUF881 domain-containing protein [Armatimonadota bacterium]
MLGTSHTLRVWKVSRLQATLAALLAAVGFLAATQVRNELLIRRHLRVPSQRLEELGFLLREQERARSALEQQIVELRERLRAYEQGVAQGRARMEALSQDLERLRTLAGLVAVVGPGVVVELDDSPQPLRPGDDPNTVILHYTDLQAVVNDLWAGGADAVAINGERVVVSTGLTCVGTTILCNAKRIAPPYRITAIGNPAALQAYLTRPGGILEALRAFGFPVKVTTASRLVVPAYRGGYRFTFARPAEAPP